MQNVPLVNASHDPMAWQHAANALQDLGLVEAARICHDTAGDMFRDANAVDAILVTVIEREMSDTQTE